MVAFLRDRLQVPEDHIAFLSDESATRGNIISTFSKHLTQNEEILEGDAMIVYYAGHGSRVPAPEGWQASDGQIETICPHDEGMQTADGKVITGIPDRTVNTLLRELAAKKGNNIVSNSIFGNSLSLLDGRPFCEERHLRFLPLRWYYSQPIRRASPLPATPLPTQSTPTPSRHRQRYMVKQHLDRGCRSRRQTKNTSWVPIRGHVVSYPSRCLPSRRASV